MRNPPAWYIDHENLHALWLWLEDHGHEPDVACFLEKPWHWEPEWLQMRAELAQDAA
jgi:hypothetical protein